MKINKVFNNKDKDESGIGSSLIRPLYNDKEVEKAVDVRVGELIPQPPSINRELVTLADYNQALDEIDSLLTQLELVSNTNTELTSEVSRLQGEVISLRAELDGVKNTNTGLQSSLSGIQSQLQTAMTDLTAARTAANTADSQKVLAQAEKLAAQGRADSLQQTINSLNTQIASLQAALTNAEKPVNVAGGNGGGTPPPPSAGGGGGTMPTTTQSTVFTTTSTTQPPPFGIDEKLLQSLATEQSNQYKWPQLPKTITAHKGIYRELNIEFESDVDGLELFVENGSSTMFNWNGMSYSLNMGANGESKINSNSFIVPRSLLNTDVNIEPLANWLINVGNNLDIYDYGIWSPSQMWDVTNTNEPKWDLEGWDAGCGTGTGLQSTFGSITGNQLFGCALRKSFGISALQPINFNEYYTVDTSTSPKKYILPLGLPVKLTPYYNGVSIRVSSIANSTELTNWDVDVYVDDVLKISNTSIPTFQLAESIYFGPLNSNSKVKVSIKKSQMLNIVIKHDIPNELQLLFDSSRVLTSPPRVHIELQQSDAFSAISFESFENMQNTITPSPNVVSSTFAFIDRYYDDIKLQVYKNTGIVIRHSFESSGRAGNDFSIIADIDNVLGIGGIVGTSTIDRSKNLFIYKTINGENAYAKKIDYLPKFTGNSTDNPDWVKIDPYEFSGGVQLPGIPFPAGGAYPTSLPYTAYYYDNINSALTNQNKKILTTNMARSAHGGYGIINQITNFGIDKDAEVVIHVRDVFDYDDVGVEISIISNSNIIDTLYIEGGRANINISKKHTGVYDRTFWESSELEFKISIPTSVDHIDSIFIFSDIGPNAEPNIIYKYVTPLNSMLANTHSQTMNLSATNFRLRPIDAQSSTTINQNLTLYYVFNYRDGRSGISYATLSFVNQPTLTQGNYKEYKISSGFDTYADAGAATTFPISVYGPSQYSVLLAFPFYTSAAGTTPYNGNNKWYKAESFQTLVFQLFSNGEAGQFYNTDLLPPVVTVSTPNVPVSSGFTVNWTSVQTATKYEWEIYRRTSADNAQFFTADRLLSGETTFTSVDFPQSTTQTLTNSGDEFYIRVRALLPFNGSEYNLEDVNTVYTDWSPNTTMANFLIN